ncbi:hypothetical protein B566_EDAN007380 [Ephemera danica]|nr:hypothetical protein B566_EDAN007380 [Ephemera danica]
MPDKPNESKEQEQEKMPEGENKPAITQPERPEPVAEREVTQTDRLNKKLLSSLLERMNSSDTLADRFKDSQDNGEGENSGADQDEFAP